MDSNTFFFYRRTERTITSSRVPFSSFPMLFFVCFFKSSLLTSSLMRITGDHS